MPKAFLTLTLMPDRFAICRLVPDGAIPAWAFQGDFFSVTKAPDELSIVCADRFVPEDVKSERGWRALKFEGPLDIELTGVVASVAEPLANAGVPIFPLATYGTDYILIKEEQIEIATHALTTFGHAVRE
jgi:uncharacterized protein